MASSNEATKTTAAQNQPAPDPSLILQQTATTTTATTAPPPLPLNAQPQSSSTINVFADVPSQQPQPPPPPPLALGGINVSESIPFCVEGLGTDKNRFFYEDEVFSFDHSERIRFGLVMETYDANYSDSEQSDVEDTLKQGEVRVAWHPRGVEEVLSESGLGLADRTLMPGDVVRRVVPGQQTQKGYCREVRVSADLNVKGTSCMLRNVQADRLRGLQTTVRDNAVCLDSWVGNSKLVDLKLLLRTPCGALLELRPDQEYTRLCDADSQNRKGFFANASFYPGQILVGPLHALERESVKWLDENGLAEVRNTKGKISFTVVNVEIEGIMVQWKCKALSGVGDINELELLSDHMQPKSYVTGDDLKRLRRLNIFESCMLQINDKNYLTIEPGDVDNATKKHTWRRECAVACGRKGKTSAQSAPADTAILKSLLSTTSNVPTVSVTNATDIGSVQESADGAAATTPNAGETGISSGDIDESDGWTTEEEQTQSGLLPAGDVAGHMGSMDSVISSCCSTSTPRNSPKRSPLLRNMKRMQMRRQQRHNKAVAAAAFDIAQMVSKEVVTETRVVYSTATIVWQDGTIESEISSRQLYPIHHLDEHEFFPGDFVLSGENMSYRHYGVIQRVDHVGRTAIVKWFSTYSSVGEPIPIYFNETEVSVYDLKDHPDFQFRPGTIVIRVANFIGEDATCTAGQVVDNFAEGRVKVWWVDGHYSMCWPQDLFEVGNYDSDHNYWTSDGDEEEEEEANEGESDNGSWETDSADSPIGTPTTAKTTAAIHEATGLTADDGDDVESMMRHAFECGQPYMRSLERLMHAIEHLQEIFCANPKLENVDAMTKLLELYKKCRFMDRLLETSFFHEDRFAGLIERVRRTAGNNGSPSESSGAAAGAAVAASNHACPTTPTANGIVSSTTTTITTPTAITRAINHKKRLFGELPANGSIAVPVLSPPAQHPLKMPPISPSSSMHIKTSIKQKQYKISRPEICVELPDTQINDEDNIVDELLMNDSGSYSSVPKDATSASDVKCGNFFKVNVGSATKQHSTANHQLSLDLNSGSASGEASPFTYGSNSRYSSNTSHSSNSSSLSKPGDENSTNSCCSLSHNMSNGAANETTENSSVHTADEGVSSANDELDTGINGCDSGVGGTTAAIDEELSEYACARLCTLLKNQMRVALREVSDRHFKKKFAKIMDFRAACRNDADDCIVLPTTLSAIRALPLCKSSPLPSVDTDKLNKIADDLISVNCNETASNAGPHVLRNAGEEPLEPLPASNATLPAPPPRDCFAVHESAPATHHYVDAKFEPVNAGQFYRTVSFDHTLLQSSLPPGVWARAYEDRIDLLSVMIAGPAHTPYEDGMFLFDVQLSKEYPRTPPLFHYISFCADRLNPNLYEDGKVCVSLLGTWSGKGSEVWGPGSTLLQVIVSIQGLILVAEPYFNEAGYEKQKGSQQGIENSRMYNEMVIIKLVQSTTKLLQQPGVTFSEEILKHFSERGRLMYDRLRGWLNASNAHNNKSNTNADADVANNDHANVDDVAQFPLVPASRGFCLTLTGLLEVFREKVERLVAP